MSNYGITSPIIKFYINIPHKPLIPYIQKKLYISLPDANPAPIIVPIKTKQIFKILLIKITFKIIFKKVGPIQQNAKLYLIIKIS